MRFARTYLVYSKLCPGVGVGGWRAWERCPPNICSETQPFVGAKVKQLLQEVIYSPMCFKTGTYVCTHTLGPAPSRAPQSTGSYFHGAQKAYVQRERPTPRALHGCFT